MINIGKEKKDATCLGRQVLHRQALAMAEPPIFLLFLFFVLIRLRLDRSLLHLFLLIFRRQPVSMFGDERRRRLLLGVLLLLWLLLLLL